VTATRYLGSIPDQVSLGPYDPVPPPRPGLPLCRVFPGENSQLSVMRAWLAGLLPDRPARHDVACVATELSSNAVRHTASGRGGWFTVGIARLGALVRVAVSDGGAPLGPRMPDDPAAESGRGLLIVCGLSARAGVCGDHRGRTVWAELIWS